MKLIFVQNYSLTLGMAWTLADVTRDWVEGPIIAQEIIFKSTFPAKKIYYEATKNGPSGWYQN